MFAQEETLVGGIDYDGIVQFSAFLQIIQHLSYALVHGKDCGKIVAHILLILPPHQFPALEHAAAVFRNSACIDAVPFGLHILRHPEIDLGEAVGRLGKHFLAGEELEVPVFGEGLLQAHILTVGRCTSARIVVKQVFRLREDAVVVYAQVLRGRHPVAVRCLVVHHQAERFAPVAGIEVFYGLAGDDFGDIALFGDFLSHLLELGVVIVALFLLAGKHAPEIEALRL